MKSRKKIIGTVIGIGLLIIITGGCIKPAEWPAQLAHKLDLPSTIEPDNIEIANLNEDFEENWNQVRKFYTEEEGGRKTLPHQHIRSDFFYDHEVENSGLFMIYPEFLSSGFFVD